MIGDKQKTINNKRPLSANVRDSILGAQAFAPSLLFIAYCSCPASRRLDA